MKSHFSSLSLDQLLAKIDQKLFSCSFDAEYLDLISSLDSKKKN